MIRIGQPKTVEGERVDVAVPQADPAPALEGELIKKPEIRAVFRRSYVPIGDGNTYHNGYFYRDEDGNLLESPK